MGFLSGLTTDIRYLIALPGFIRRPITLAESEAEVRRRLLHREQNFIDLVERAVFAYPESPYARLFRHAGIALSDVKRDVQELGLEATLHKLHDAGIYLRAEEMKGRIPIKRGDLEFLANPGDFDNPLVGPAHMVSVSSGSMGRPMITRISLKSTAAESMDMILATASHRAARPYALWGPRSSAYGIAQIVRTGTMPAKLFATQATSWGRDGFRQNLFVTYVRIVNRLFGRSLPKPETVLRNQPEIIARWFAEMTARGTPAYIVCHANPAVRICLAAREHGLDITGTLFLIGGEPYTPGKAAVLKSAGVIVHPFYAMTETGGLVGMSCEHAAALDDVHVFTDKLALISRDREIAPGSHVDSLLLTSVLQDAPRLLINFETGDYGTLTQRECSCVLGNVGFNTHLHGIRSYEKLTSEGNTFVGSRLYELVEEVLPARFGGSVNDYQLAEEEEADGLTRVSIVVSPSVGAVDDSAVISTVLETLARSHTETGSKIMLAMWRQGDNLRVVRRDPYVTSGVKVQPLHILRRSQASLGK